MGQCITVLTYLYSVSCRRRSPRSCSKIIIDDAVSCISIKNYLHLAAIRLTSRLSLLEYVNTYDICSTVYNIFIRNLQILNEIRILFFSALFSFLEILLGDTAEF